MDLSTEALGTAPGRGRLTGRRILVVGAGQQTYGLEDPPIGNGRAMSRLFAREGAAVAAADLDADSAAETVREITEDEGATAHAIAADVSRPEDVERMVAEATAALGGLDGLVANVGIPGGAGLDHTTPEDWDRVFTVNVRGHWLSVKHALDVMPDGSSVVLISSAAAHMVGTPYVTYHVTKTALDGLCMWLAKEGARRGTRVNIVMPGLIDTSLGRMATQANPGRGRYPVPLGRQGTAWEVAYAATFLLSGEASFVTGSTLVVDGGMLALR